METREALRHQLDALADLQAIVRTMKALSASTIREYEKAVAALADYERNVEHGFAAALEGYSQASLAGALAPGQQTRSRLVVIFGSDHGLCGRFNEQIADHLLEHWQTRDREDEPPRVLAVGLRLEATLAARDIIPDAVLELPATSAEIVGSVQVILQRIDRWQQAGDFREITVLHHQASDHQASRPRAHRLLPLPLARLHRLRASDWPSRRLPQRFLTGEGVLSALIREYLLVGLFRACAASQASEHASRLAAMQRAESNLSEHMESVTAAYRRRRQDAITSELLDVVSGFEAVADT